MGSSSKRANAYRRSRGAAPSRADVRSARDDESEEAGRLAREASQAKDQFLATLSHELRTPLTPILAAVDSLKDVALSAGARTAVEVIRRNVRAEARLIDDLLDVARITQKKLVLGRQPLDLHDTLRQVVEDWRTPLAAASIDLRLELRASRHHVAGDPARLGQVCRNLLSNAAKFTDTGGTIRLTTENIGHRVVITVTDTGIGMCPEQAGRAFEPFVQFSNDTSRRSGLGLGLVICRGILDAHEGSIRASSDGPGKGATFTFDLPVIARPSVAPHLAQASRTMATPAATGKRLLLVEDHRDSAEMLSLLLRTEGYEVTVARSKREGLARVSACDLVISDIGLPDGTGLELISEAHRDTAVRGIALSGFGSEQDVQRSLEAGFTEHLTKPVDFDRLLAAVRKLAG